MEVAYYCSILGVVGYTGGVGVVCVKYVSLFLWRGYCVVVCAYSLMCIWGIYVFVVRASYEPPGFYRD